MQKSQGCVYDVTYVRACGKPDIFVKEELERERFLSGKHQNFSN